MSISEINEDIIDNYKIEKSENESSEQLKLKLLEKLKEIKMNLDELKINNIQDKNNLSKMSTISEYKKYIDNFKTHSEKYLNDKEKNISDKETCNLEYSNFMKRIIDLEILNKNMSNILLNSLQNYNDFLLQKLPYYKELATKYLINKSETLGRNNIFSKLNDDQIYNISNRINNKRILYLINGKNPMNLKIIPSDDLIEAKSLFDSTIKYEKNEIELNDLKDEDFKFFFNKENNINDKNIKRGITLQNCELKTIDISSIPYDITDLNILNSKISSSIFEKNLFNNLVSLVIDNSKLHSNNFENIIKVLLRKDNQICNHLKLLSAKNNYISRIIKKEELIRITNKFNCLEILNLSNNIICDINQKILEYIPNIKILDLSNNNITQEYKCKELIKNCKGIVLLLRNIGIMRENMNNYYKEYYFKKLKEKDYPIYSINLNSLFYKRNYEDILKIDFSHIKKNKNIIELNLSSCNIDNITMIKILCHCVAINNNINKVDLSLNLLSEKFFDLLIKKNLNIVLGKMTKLNLSFNNINFVGTQKYDIDNSKNNQFILFLNNFPQIELLLLKGTPFEDKINEYIKKEVTRYYENEKRHETVTELTNEFIEIKNIVEKNYLGVNPKFFFVINDLLSVKYTRRFKQILSPIFFEHVVVDNIKQEEKK